MSPALQVDSLPAEPQGKPRNTGVGSLSLLQWIFPSQELNWSLLHCRGIIYQVRYQESPFKNFMFIFSDLTVFSKISVPIWFGWGGIVLHQDSLRNTEIDSVKIKKCYSQEGPAKMKWHPAQWKKMFATHRTDKDLVSKMYKELIEIN